MKIKTVRWIAVIFMVLGIVGLFSSIWASGWNILRLFITAILLHALGYMMSEIAKKLK